MKRDTYDTLVKRMPVCLEAGFDPQRATTIADLRWYVRTSLDLYEEGEETDIGSARECATARRYLARITAASAPKPAAA